MGKAAFSSLGILILFGVVVRETRTAYDGLDDNVLYKIDWPGPLPLDMGMETEPVLMKTSNKESYQCTLPKVRDRTEDNTKDVPDASPFELISPLFNQFICTFKLETYWTYELCHGKYIRQYHEEREGKKVKLQEYYLGRWDKEDLQKSRTKIEEEYSGNGVPQLPLRRVDGISKPALQLNMSDGTFCELNGLPRLTRVLYVCDPRGKHDIHSLEEVSTCEYEIVVLSPLLCQHSEFKTNEGGENVISCYSTDGVPKKPKALTDVEEETTRIKHEQLLQNLESLLDTKIKSDGFKTSELSNANEGRLGSTDSTFLQGFLSGKDCLNGGSHWWRVEFCFNKHVLQYHEEHPGAKTRTEIMLGRWDEKKHKEWIQDNPHKRPSISSTKRSVYHFYDSGDSCDQTGQPRSVEVKIRCIDNPSPSAVSLYLLEHSVCNYQLVVESSLFCPLLKTADESGMFDISQYVKPTKTKSRVQKEEKPYEDLEVIVLPDEAENRE